jgi:hypothetical protein
MTRKMLVWFIVVAAMAVVLGGASLIVANSGTSAAGDAPSGFVH